ncbi:DnaJ family molecular chaperone [Amorphus orientalis]|uniref:DnaJ like chaperone protein n=1 Tax=Amorphus orientalis TaxID=649198 RepID=A0AAE4ARR3_9HYPH|nr:DnaJ family molecular chaperone [Amorphus orientalis]MDQ0314145.1 DnaJ like chaperone protein [Amorphus orientalis]
MSIWSRVTAAVQDISSVGADLIERIVGAVAGTEEERRAVAFTAAIVALSAKMAKADGVVTSEEVAAFRRNVQIPPHEVRNVDRLFRLAQQDVAGFEAYARRIANLFPGDDAFLADIVDVLFMIAAADGVVHEHELAVLERISELFGMDGSEFRRLKARHVREGSIDPYLVLGIDPDSDAEALKRHYRKLVAEHHPDRLIARGVPAEFVDVANARLAAINSAYEQVRRERRL